MARPDPPPVPLLFGASLLYGLVAAGAWGWAAVFGHGEVLLGERLPRATHLLAAAGAGLAVVAACRAAHRWSPGVRRASAILRALLGPVRLPQAAYLAAISGFAEELAFRGALWPHAGILWTSLLFGLAHFVPLRALLAYPLFAFAVGLLFGWLRGWSGSLWPPVVAHMTVNGLNLAWIGRMPPPPREGAA